jgi:hypothetical protein
LAGFHFDRNRPDFAQIAPVDPRLAVQHALTDDLLFEFAEEPIDVRGAEPRRITAGEHFDRTRAQSTDLGLTLLLVGGAVRRAQIGFDQVADGSDQRIVLRCDGNFPTSLPGLGSEFLDRLDCDLHRIVAEQHAAEHLVFRQLLRFRLHHQHGRLGACDDHVQSRFLQRGVTGVQQILAVLVTDARSGDRTVERQTRYGERRGRTDQRRDVRIHVLVRRHDRADDLDFVPEPFREQRAYRTIDQAARQRLFLGRPTFTPEETTGDLARGIGFFLVIHSQRKEVDARANRFQTDDRAAARRFHPS